MLAREVKYYFMTNQQLHEEIMGLRFKLNSEQDVKKKIKYLNALADIMKMLIRKYRHDEEFMKHVNKELNKLRLQIKANL